MVFCDAGYAGFVLNNTVGSQIPDYATRHIRHMWWWNGSNWAAQTLAPTPNAGSYYFTNYTGTNNNQTAPRARIAHGMTCPGPK